MLKYTTNNILDLSEYLCNNYYFPVGIIELLKNGNFPRGKFFIYNNVKVEIWDESEKTDVERVFEYHCGRKFTWYCMTA